MPTRYVRHISYIFVYVSMTALGRAEGTADGDRVEILITLAEAYEEAHFPMDMPDPIEAIKFRLSSKA